MSRLPTTTIERDPGQIDEALAWYQNGTLSASDRSWVEVRLAQDPKLRQQLHIDAETAAGFASLLERVPADIGWAGLQQRMQADTASLVAEASMARAGADARALAAGLDARALAASSDARALVAGPDVRAPATSRDARSLAPSPDARAVPLGVDTGPVVSRGADRVPGPPLPPVPVGADPGARRARSQRWAPSGHGVDRSRSGAATRVLGWMSALVTPRLGAALASLLVIQTIALGYLIGTREPTPTVEYRTAGLGRPVTVIRVLFEDSVTEGKLSAGLAQQQATIIDGPNALGEYWIATRGDPAEIARALDHPE